MKNPTESQPRKKYEKLHLHCLFVCFQTKTSHQLSLFEVDKCLQLRMRTDTQTVLWDCNDFFSSHTTTLCCAMLPNWQPTWRYGLPDYNRNDALEMFTRIDSSTFFGHPIPGVVTSLPLLLLIARYIQQSRDTRPNLNNE